MNLEHTQNQGALQVAPEAHAALHMVLGKEMTTSILETVSYLPDMYRRPDVQLMRLASRPIEYTVDGFSWSATSFYYLKNYNIAPNPIKKPFLAANCDELNSLLQQQISIDKGNMRMAEAAVRTKQYFSGENATHVVTILESPWVPFGIVIDPSFGVITTTHRHRGYEILSKRYTINNSQKEYTNILGIDVALKHEGICKPWGMDFENQTELSATIQSQPSTSYVLGMSDKHKTMYSMAFDAEKNIPILCLSFPFSTVREMYWVDTLNESQHICWMSSSHQKPTEIMNNTSSEEIFTLLTQLQHVIAVPKTSEL